MKILFLGLGSIGERHAKIIKKKYDFELYAYRTHKGLEENNLGIEEIYDFEEAFEINPDVVFITNPTFLHIKTALECAEYGIDMFIEKPLSNTFDGVEELREKAREKNLFVYVGLCMRFHPVLEELKKIVDVDEVIYVKTTATSYLPSWRPDQNYRESYSADSGKGGGILLDLIHELDYNYWLFGDIKRIDGNYGKISNLEIDSEDFGDMLIEYKNGIKGSIHLNCFSFKNERIIKIYCNERYIEGDLINNQIKIIDDGGSIKEKKFDFEIDMMYENQLDYFFKCYRNKGERMGNLDEAAKVLKYLLKFKSGKLS